MIEYKKIIEQAKIGSIIPVIKTLSIKIDPVEYFAKLSDYGRKPNSLLFESAEITEKYGEQSIGTVNPCLIVKGKEEDFEILALNEFGEKFLGVLKGDFDFCDEVSYGNKIIRGKLSPERKNVSEEERLKLKTHADILRKIAFKFKPLAEPVFPYAGLFGAISYDFIDQFEDLPKNQSDILENPDYIAYFVDNLFVIDHKKQKMHIIANALITDKDIKKVYDECINKIGYYEKALKEKIPEPKKFENGKLQFSSDTTKEEYEKIIEKMKEHIVRGDIFQAVVSRTLISSYNAEPFDIYKELKKLNPSPYMFFFNFGGELLLGASPERYVGVYGKEEKIIEIKPIAGTKPRGIIGGKIDIETDNRYETELKTDLKELAEHVMLVDLARNDVARVSKPGTRIVSEPFVVEKYSHVQHLVSTVKGVLKNKYDALHAYIASMNMGTLTGAPKIKAMELLRRYEKTKRGFYGGAVFYLTPSNDFDSAIIIRSMQLKNNKAYLRAGAGIVYDSDAKREYEETQNKLNACMKALERAGASDLSLPSPNREEKK